MVKAKVQIKNKLGLHARPAAEFVKLAAKFRSDIHVSKNEHTVNGKSIMGVMTLAAEMGSELNIVASGVDEKNALEALSQLVNNKFYED
jgi:phosphocarrier protein HPr